MGKDAASEAGKWYAETWDGGYVRVDAKGRRVYVIRRMLNGKTYKVSTRAHTLRAAMEQLKRFEADPDGYSPEAWREAYVVEMRIYTALNRLLLTHLGYEGVIVVWGRTPIGSGSFTYERLPLKREPEAKPEAGGGKLPPTEPAS